MSYGRQQGSYGGMCFLLKHLLLTYLHLCPFERPDQLNAVKINKYKSKNLILLRDFRHLTLYFGYEWYRMFQNVKC